MVFIDFKNQKKTWFKPTGFFDPPWPMPKPINRHIPNKNRLNLLFLYHFSVTVQRCGISN